MPAPEVEGALQELLAFEVFRQTEDGTIYSPRLVAEHQDYLKNRETGRKGGEASAKARAHHPAANSAPEAPVDPPAKGRVGKVANPPLKGGFRQRATPPQPRKRRRKRERDKNQNLFEASLQAAAPPPDVAKDDVPQQAAAPKVDAAEGAAAKPPPHRLFTEGKVFLEEILPPGNGNIYAQIKRLQRLANYNDDIAFEAIVETRGLTGQYAKFCNWGTIQNKIQQKVAAAAGSSGSRPALVVSNEPADPDDPWGIQAWCKTVPGVIPTKSDWERRHGNWMTRDAILDPWAEMVVEAMGLPPTWRGDLNPILGWIQLGLDLEDVVRKIKDVRERKPDAGWRYIDTAVRDLARSGRAA